MHRLAAPVLLLVLALSDGARAQFDDRVDSVLHKKALSFDVALEDTFKEAKGEHEFDISELLALQSISGDPSHKHDWLETAAWLVGRLGYAGAENVQQLSTTGGQPAVYGDWLNAGSDKPTILIYGHYDVKPLPETNRWAGPFQMRVELESYYGRGMAGGKGALLLAVQGVEAAYKCGVLTATRKQGLPVNIKMLVEGQAEISSPDFPALLKKHSKLLAADAILSTVGGPKERAPGVQTPAPNVVNTAIDKVWTHVFDGPPTYNRDTSATPALKALDSVLGSPISVFGWGLGDNIHASNERLKMKSAAQGRDAWGRLMEELGKASVAMALRQDKASALKSEL